MGCLSFLVCLGAFSALAVNAATSLQGAGKDVSARGEQRENSEEITKGEEPRRPSTTRPL